MTGLAALFALLAVFQAGPPQIDQPEDQWGCSSIQSGSRESGVEVDIQVTTSGEVLDVSTAWDPPIAGHEKSPKAYLEAPSLRIFFDKAGADSMGPVTGALGSVFSQGGPKNGLADKWLSVSVDGAGDWRGMLEKSDFIPELKLDKGVVRWRSVFLANSGEFEPVNPDLVQALEGGSAVRLAMVDSDDRPLGATLYDLRDTAERDRLFAVAWAQAQELTHHLDKCVKAQEYPGDLGVPAP